MDLCIYFGIVSSQRRRGWTLGKRRTLILATAVITDLSQEKLLYPMIYFGMTGGSPSFILPKASAGFFLLFPFMIFFFWCAVENEGFHLFQCSSNQLFFFIRNMFSLDLRMLTEANINSAWQSVLPKRQDKKTSFRDRCRCMEVIVANFHKQCLEWFITFYDLKCVHFIDLVRIIMFTPFIYRTALMYEQFSFICPL